MRARLAVIALAVTLYACRTVEIPVAPEPTPGVQQGQRVQQFVEDRLFFGRGIPAGGFVSDADWDKFLAEVVTKALPAGFTVFQTYGQWLDPRGTIVKEPGYVIQVDHEPSAHMDSLISAVALEYKKRFGQDAVLRITSPATLRFY